MFYVNSISLSQNKTISLLEIQDRTRHPLALIQNALYFKFYLIIMTFYQCEICDIMLPARSKRCACRLFLITLIN